MLRDCDRSWPKGVDVSMPSNARTTVRRKGCDGGVPDSGSGIIPGDNMANLLVSDVEDKFPSPFPACVKLFHCGQTQSDWIFQFVMPVHLHSGRYLTVGIAPAYLSGRLVPSSGRSAHCRHPPQQVLYPHRPRIQTVQYPPRLIVCRIHAAIERCTVTFSAHGQGAIRPEGPAPVTSHRRNIFAF